MRNALPLLRGLALLILTLSFVTLLALYLVTMSHSPNRVYYAQFADMDDAELGQTVLHVALYMGFELISLGAAQLALYRLLGVSPMHQLGFVLSRQAVQVQSALVLWMVISTQGSLDHYGKNRPRVWAIAAWFGHDAMTIVCD